MIKISKTKKEKEKKVVHQHGLTNLCNLNTEKYIGTQNHAITRVDLHLAT